MSWADLLLASRSKASARCICGTLLPHLSLSPFSSRSQIYRLWLTRPCWHHHKCVGPQFRRITTGHAITRPHLIGPYSRHSRKRTDSSRLSTFTTPLSLSSRLSSLPIQHVGLVWRGSRPKEKRCPEECHFGTAAAAGYVAEKRKVPGVTDGRSRRVGEEEYIDE